jgi:hypothetical protein
MTQLVPAQALRAGPFSPGLRRSIVVIMIGASLPFLDSTIVRPALRAVSVTRRAHLAGVQRAGNDIATMVERFGADEDYVDTPGSRRRFPGIYRHGFASWAHAVNGRHVLGA